MTTRTLKRKVIDLGEKIRSQVKDSIRDFLPDAEGIFIKFVQDFDSRDFIKSMEKRIQIDIDENVFTFESSLSEDDSDLIKLLGDKLFKIFNAGFWAFPG